MLKKNGVKRTHVGSHWAFGLARTENFNGAASGRINDASGGGLWLNAVLRERGYRINVMIKALLDSMPDQLPPWEK